MSFFNFMAEALGAASRVAAGPARRPAAVVPETECTPCSANAYAEQTAQSVRAMFGGAEERARKAKKAKGRR